MHVDDYGLIHIFYHHISISIHYNLPPSQRVEFLIFLVLIESTNSNKLHRNRQSEGERRVPLLYFLFISVAIVVAVVIVVVVVFISIKIITSFTYKYLPTNTYNCTHIHTCIYISRHNLHSMLVIFYLKGPSTSTSSI